jgi:hypothetical protein
VRVSERGWGVELILKVEEEEGLPTDQRRRVNDAERGRG